MATFRTTILSSGKTAAGIRISDEIVEGFGAGRKPAVKVTIGAHTYRTTVARRGDSYLVGVSAENRTLAGVAAGDEVDVTLELDTEPREVTVPADLTEALEAAGARESFDRSSYTVRKEIVRGVEEAKKPETRQRRIERAVSGLNT
jgi:hypothetical protein